MEKKNSKIAFALNKITTEQFAIIEECFVEGKDVDLGTNLKFGLDKINKTVAVFVMFKFEQNKRPFLIIEVGCHFLIFPEAWDSFIDEESKILTVPKGFISHLTALTIGTARGVLHAKTENTPYNMFFIPTINVTDLIKEDVLLNL